MQSLLASAIREHQAGRLAEAQKLYLQVLAIDVRHAQSLYGLSLIAHQTGNCEGAVRLLRRAVSVHENEAAYHSALAAALLELGNTSEALIEFRRVLELRPGDDQAHFNLGSIFLENGKLGEARLHLNRAVALRPDFAAAHHSMGLLLAREGRLDEAQASYRRALALHPDSTDTLNNFGNLLSDMGEFELARECFERAITAKPNCVEAHSNLGVALRELGLLDEAHASLERALALKPDFVDALNNLGIVHRERGELAESRACHERALALRPDDADAFLNLGNTLRSLGDLNTARQCFDRALSLKPQLAEAQWNRSLVELLQGDFEAGWRDFEARHRRKKARPRSLSQPQWRGEPLNGARILLHSEQGLGDALQFMRFVPMVHAAGGEVILEVPRTLFRLAQQLPGITELVATGGALPAFDWQCPLMSLALAFGLSLHTIPARVPYLALPEEARRDAARLAWPEDGMRIGLVWSGNPRYPEDRFRSIPFAGFEKLLDIEGVRFFSLQLGPAAEQLTHALVTDLRPAIHDMADTAALLAHLDLLITVDTGVAHLAGALARPTWLLLPFAPDWRWLMDREDSPWYPTMRLFRQPGFGDWAAVLARVREELSAFARRGRA